MLFTPNPDETIREGSYTCLLFLSEKARLGRMKKAAALRDLEKGIGGFAYGQLSKHIAEPCFCAKMLG